jgi:hypothetical protein
VATVQSADHGDGYIPGYLSCEAANTGNSLTVCAAHDFQMVAPKLIGFGNISMKECASVTIQSVP